MVDSTVWTNAERADVPVGDTLRTLMARFNDPDVFVSVISVGELLHGWWRAVNAEVRVRRGVYLENLVATVPVVNVTLPVVRVFGEIDARLATIGKRLPTADMLIASCAVYRRCDIVTGNVRHFQRVPGLKVHQLA